MRIYILSRLWKNGAIIERLKDGNLEVSNVSKVPRDVLKAAEKFGDEIDNYLKSVEGMNNIDKTIHKMMMVFAGWQSNNLINTFINEDEVALNLFLDYQAKLNGNGFKDIYSDYREYETQETKLIKIEIHKRAVNFFKKGSLYENLRDFKKR